jgi:hypothetical protein
MTAEPTLDDLGVLSARLVRLRWVAAALTVPAAWFAWGGPPMLFLDMSGMIVVAGLLALTNLVVLSHARRTLGEGASVPARTAHREVSVWLQLAADTVALSMAFRYAGGIETPLAFFGTVHVAAVASTLGSRAALRMVAMLVTGVGVVVMLELNRAVYHFHVMNDWRWGVQKDPKYVAVYGAFLLGTWLATAFIPARARSG